MSEDFEKLVRISKQNDGSYLINGVRLGNCSTCTERIAELEDELAATKRELKLTRGQFTTTLNNWEQAKGKLRREKAALDERKRNLDARDAQTAEQMCAEQANYWKAQCEKAREERDEWRAMCGELMDAAGEIRRIADTRMPKGAIR